MIPQFFCLFLLFLFKLEKFFLALFFKNFDLIENI